MALDDELHMIQKLIFNLFPTISLFKTVQYMLHTLMNSSALHFDHSLFRVIEV
jgi:hypothetical protein